MKSETFAQADTRQRTQWNHATERWAERRRLGGIVVTAYIAVHSLQPVAALNLDPDVREREGLWTPEAAHFKIDVSNTVRRCIEAKPEAERTALWDAWKNLLVDDVRIGPAEKRLIQALAPKFFANKLHPGVYFKPNKHPEKRGAR